MIILFKILKKANIKNYKNTFSHLKYFFMQKFNLKARLSAVALLGSVSMMGAALVPAAAQAEPVQAQSVYYSQAELDRLLAPIALYPDSLLSHVLIAATYCGMAFVLGLMVFVLYLDLFVHRGGN